MILPSRTRTLVLLLATCTLAPLGACGLAAAGGDDPAADEDGVGEGEGEGEGDSGEGEGEGDSGEGEGEGEGDGGEGEGEGEGDPPPPPDSELELRTSDEVCAQWRSFDAYTGQPWAPLGDGSDQCDVGALADGAQDAAIARVNLYRWLAGLPAVGLEDGLIAQQQACAAVLVGIGHLDHFPQQDAPCYSPEGAAGAGSSNLAQGTDATGSVDLFVGDGGVGSLGHRRWVLNPGMAGTAFGFKGAFTCMYSFSSGGSANPGFVSWPPPGPVPTEAATGRYSFGTNAFGATASTKIEVNVDGAGFVEVPFDDLGWGYGSLSTTLAFDLPGLQPWDIAAANRVVSVRISGLQSSSSTNESVAWTTRYVGCP